MAVAELAGFERVTFGVRRLAFNVQRSTFSVHRLAFNVRRSKRAGCAMANGKRFLFRNFCALR
jgi:hypothetical protein